MGQPQDSQVAQVSQGAQGSQQQCVEGNVFTQGHLRWKCQDGFPQPFGIYIYKGHSFFINKWKQCIVISACIGSERIKNQEIPINSTKTIDGYWYKCQIEGTSVKYQEGTNNDININTNTGTDIDINISALMLIVVVYRY